LTKEESNEKLINEAGKKQKFECLIKAIPGGRYGCA
jgi:hypothetical protein